MRLQSLAKVLPLTLRVEQRQDYLRVYRSFLGMHFEVSEKTFMRAAVSLVAKKQRDKMSAVAEALSPPTAAAAKATQAASTEAGAGAKKPRPPASPDSPGAAKALEAGQPKPDKLAFELYLKAMALPQTFGGTGEMQAIAQTHGVAIRVFTANEKGKIFRHAHTVNPAAERTYDLVLRQNHFNYSKKRLPDEGFAMDSPQHRGLGNVADDGACLFHCLAALMGRPHTAASLRADAVNYLRANADSMIDEGLTLAQMAISAGAREAV